LLFRDRPTVRKTLSAITDVTSLHRRCVGTVELAIVGGELTAKRMEEESVRCPLNDEPACSSSQRFVTFLLAEMCCESGWSQYSNFGHKIKKILAIVRSAGHHTSSSGSDGQWESAGQMWQCLLRNRMWDMV